jgi:hypothetical protein
MKRFRSRGENGREGREVLSFEGGEAGARTFSRRQALGLLGGSLAGASLLSLGVADPAKSTHVPHHPPFRNFDHIALESTGGYLEGRIQDGTVGLAPNTNPPGTRWEAVQANPGKWPPKEWWFFCRANWPRPAGAPYYEPGPRWLAPRTQNNTVRLAPHRGAPFTGTKWIVHADRVWDPAAGGFVDKVVLESLGRVVVVRRAPDRPVWSVGLGPSPFGGGGDRFWRVRILPK